MKGAPIAMRRRAVAQAPEAEAAVLDDSSVGAAPAPLEASAPGAAEEVGDGKLHHNIPRRMRVASAYDVCVSVSRDPTDAAARDMEGAVRTHEIRVSGVLAVELRDLEDAFDICALTPTQQPIDHSYARSLGFETEPGPDRGFWRWRVRPRRWGSYPLCIQATAIIRDAHGNLTPAPEQSDRIHISVKVNYSRVIARALGWFAIALTGYVVVDVIGGPAAVEVLHRLRDGISEMLGLGAMF